MTMARWLSMGVCSLAAVALLAGCGPNPKDLEIQSLQERLRECQNENEDLRSRLAAAIRERDAARARAYALEQRNADLMEMMRNRPESESLPEGWDQAGDWRWVDLGTDFLFDSGKATLKPEARAKLQEVVQQINERFPGMMIWVIGHTDTDPILKTKHLWADNLDLSVNRGAAVYRELAKLGISTDRLIAGGQGEYNPEVPNTTKESKAQNRRVQIVAVPMAEAAAAGAVPPTRTSPSRLPHEK